MTTRSVSPFVIFRNCPSEIKANISHELIKKMLEKGNPSSSDDLSDDFWLQKANNRFSYFFNKKSGYLVVSHIVADRNAIGKVHIYPKKIPNTYYHMSGSGHKVVKGISLIILFWTNGVLYLPINYRIYDKDRDSKSKNDHFRAMIINAEKLGFKPKKVLFDETYAEKRTLRVLQSLEFSWFTRFSKEPKVKNKVKKDPSKYNNIYEGELELSKRFLVTRFLVNKRTTRHERRRRYKIVKKVPTKVFETEDCGVKNYWTTPDKVMSPEECKGLKSTYWDNPLKDRIKSGIVHIRRFAKKIWKRYVFPFIKSPPGIGIIIISLLVISFVQDMGTSLNAVQTAAVIGTGWLIANQLIDTKDIARGDFIVKLNKAYVENEDFIDLYNSLQTCLEGRCEDKKCENGKNCKLVDKCKDKKSVLANYLTFFETIYVLEKEKVITFSDLDDLFVYRFFLVVHSKFAQQSILKTQAEHFRHIFCLEKKWLEYRDNAQKTDIDICKERLLENLIEKDKYDKIIKEGEG